jgi:hypothetical protein
MRIMMLPVGPSARPNFIVSRVDLLVPVYLTVNAWPMLEVNFH